MPTVAKETRKTSKTKELEYDHLEEQIGLLSAVGEQQQSPVNGIQANKSLQEEQEKTTHDHDRTHIKYY